MSNGLRFAKTWQGFGWAMVGLVVWLSLTPKPPELPSLLGWDKAQHIAAYGSLAYWYGMGFARHWRWPVFLTGLGVALEFLQGLGGVRSLDIFDMFANLVGIGTGLLLLETRASRFLAELDACLAKWVGSFP